MTVLVNMLWRRFGVKSLPRISGRDPADGLHEQPCQRHDARCSLQPAGGPDRITLDSLRAMPRSFISRLFRPGEIDLGDWIVTANKQDGIATSTSYLGRRLQGAHRMRMDVL